MGPRRWAPWAVMGVLLVGALAIGAGGSTDGRTVDGRVRNLSAEVRCPTCEGLSVAESDAPASRTIRDDIRRRIEEGQSDGDIRAYLVSRFGKDILLKPEATGTSALVWALPVAALVAGAGGLLVALRRWRWPVWGAIGATAVAAGFLVAWSAGERLPGAPAAGSITPTGASDDLARARTLIGKGDAVGAIKVYDEVLAADPRNAEALAYRGWLVRLTGKGSNDPSMVDRGLELVDRSIAADPRYPDARFFRGMILYQDRNDPAGAVPEFRAFLGLDPPPEMVPMVEDVLKRALQATGQPQ
jgi:cytochrome c-type biogenesis protein CcmH